MRKQEKVKLTTTKLFPRSSPKRFIAIDGEGIDNRYVLLAASTGDELLSHRGLSTERCFRFLERLKQRNPDSVLVGFGISYDVHMMFRDLDDETLKAILFPEEKDFIEWGEWSILYFPRKILKLRRKGVETTLFDVMSFFQGHGFVSMVEKILGEKHAELEAGKSQRAVFAWQDIEAIKSYNRLELALLVRTMEKLDGLFKAEKINLRRYHGPGAVADFLLGSQGIKLHKDYPQYIEDDVPVSLWHAWDCAYYGGRIETRTVGTVKNVYVYDLNSAYPAAACLLNRMRHATSWEWRKGASDIQEDGVYLVSWKIARSEPWGPFPWRDKAGRIFFPRDGRSWIYGVELLAAMKSYPGKIKILESWSQPPQDRCKLAENIPAWYERRQELKKQGSLAELVWKLFLNSLYGKFAQRVGLAPYRCLPWAGFITAWTRAQLLDAIRGYESQIIAFGTDGIFSRCKLPLPLNNRLGGWKQERYRSLLCIMNGFYHLDGKLAKKSATRGIGKAFALPWSDIVMMLNKDGVIKTTQRAFVTHTMALHFPKRFGEDRLTFIDILKTLDPFSSSKRHFDRESLDDWSSEECGSKTISTNGALSFPSSLLLSEKMRLERAKESCHEEAVEP